MFSVSEPVEDCKDPKKQIRPGPHAVKYKRSTKPHAKRNNPNKTNWTLLFVQSEPTICTGRSWRKNMFAQEDKEMLFVSIFLPIYPYIPKDI